MTAWPENGTENWNDPMKEFVLTEHNTDGTHQWNLSPFSIKAWVTFDGDVASGSITEKDGNNIASVLKNSEGDYTITWTVPFSSVDYAVIVTSSRAQNAITNQTASAVRFITTDSTGTPSDADPIHVMTIGVQ